MIILGIDPGFGRVGWGVVQEAGGEQKAVSFGLFETCPKEKLEIRLEAIHQFARRLMGDYQPQVVAVERLFFATNAKTAMAVGQARGVILQAAASLGISVAEYTPLQVKMALTGYGRAEKRQVQEMVRNLLKLKSRLNQDDAADALAIALTHAFSYKMLARSY